MCCSAKSRSAAGTFSSLWGSWSAPRRWTQTITRPTTRWPRLIPRLVAKISRLEAEGGVERWTQAVRESADLRTSLDLANAEQQALRPDIPGGIGGSTRSGSLKCLHAHAAFALARPGYEVGERILDEVGELWPDSGCCTAE